MPSIEIHSHRLAASSAKETVSQTLNILRPFLPISLPIYRRLQVGRFFEETFLLTDLPSLNQAPPSISHDQPWFIAFLDRTSRPETEVWIFASWETEPAPPTSTQEASQETLIISLLQKIKSLPLPISHHQDWLDAQAAKVSTAADDNDKGPSGRSRSEYISHLQKTSIILLGAIHEKTSQILQRTGLKGWEDGPNHTYIFSPIPESLPTPRPLPSNLHWGQLQRSDFALVRSRTQIPRQDNTLAVLPHLAILTEDKQPVAWAFVGMDGSLTTLHVEAEYRGQGLAKAITVKLFTEKMEKLWEEGVQRAAHGYVIEGNDASSRVCTSLGGKSAWDAYWIRVDLDRV